MSETGVPMPPSMMHHHVTPQISISYFVVYVIILVIALIWVESLRSWFDYVWSKRGDPSNISATILYAVFLTLIGSITIHFILKYNKIE